MPTITQLEYILAVEKEKHFGKAAKFCHVAQPSLSMQIQKLEEELGTIIFDRSKKPIMATQTGIEVLNQARLTLKEFNKIQHIANSGSKELRGQFHLGIIPTLSPYLIPLFVGKFAKKYPQVQLKINEFQTKDIIAMLEADQLDAGLLVTPLAHDQIIERHLFFEPFYAYISANHPLTKRKLIDEKDLNTHNLWILEEGHCFRDQALKICTADRKNSGLENVEFASGSLETLKNLVKHSCGYTLLPELAAMDLPTSERKKHLKKFKRPIPTREVSLAHSRSFLKENILNALEELIIEELPSSISSLKKKDIDVVDIF